LQAWEHPLRAAVHPYFYLFEGFAEDEILSRYREEKGEARGMKLGLTFGMGRGLSGIF